MCKTTDVSSSKDHLNEVLARIPTRPTISFKKPTSIDGNFQDRQVPFNPLPDTYILFITAKANLQQQCRKPLWTIHEGVSMQSLIPHPDSLPLLANSGCQKAHFPPISPSPACSARTLPSWLGERQGSLSTVHLPVPPWLLQTRLPPSPSSELLIHLLGYKTPMENCKTLLIN